MLSGAVNFSIPLTRCLEEEMNQKDYGSQFNCELECRFGKICQQEFVAGVSSNFWDQCLKKLESYKGWTKVKGWDMSCVYQYIVPLNNTNQLIRTTVDPVINQNYQSRTHIIKQPIAKRDLKCVYTSEKYSTERWDVRVSLAREVKVNEESLPATVDTKRVSIRQRKSFMCSPIDGVPMYSIDMTMVWSGKTKHDAEQKVKTHAPEYHIECECLHPKEVLSLGGPHVILSMLKKMMDFLNANTQTLVPAISV